MDYICSYNSPLGRIIMASDGESIVGLWFDGQKNFGSTLHEPAGEASIRIFDKTKVWLDEYFSQKQPEFTPPLKLRTTNFQKIVLEYLISIPYGHTVTYGEIAGNIAEKRGVQRMSAQAVGGAVAKNPISIIIPCHRVIGSDGSLTGYAGGIEKKKYLLRLEGIL